MTDLTAKLERTLADLGDSPEAIAAYLEGQGCRAHERYGMPGAMWSQNCPVAVYLKRVFAVQTAGAGYEDTYIWSGDRQHRVTTPEPVKDFLYRFDRGKYPALDPAP